MKLGLIRHIIVISSITAICSPLSAVVPEKRWERDVRGEYDSKKSQLNLEYCIGSKIESPLIIHGEGLVEIDSYIVQSGVRIYDRGHDRKIMYVANPREDGNLREIIEGCI